MELIGSLGINFIDFIIYTLLFVVLIFIFNKYLVKPIDKILTEREKKVIDANNLIEIANKTVSEKDKEGVNIIEKANVNAEIILESAKKEALKEAKIILENAHKEAENIIETSNKKYDNDINNYKKELNLIIKNRVRNVLINLIKEKNELITDEEIDKFIDNS